MVKNKLNSVGTNGKHLPTKLPNTETWAFFIFFFCHQCFYCLQVHHNYLRTHTKFFTFFATVPF